MKQVVVIGGDATGGSAASTLKRRLRDDVTVTIVERQEWTSYSACGLPYWIGGISHGGLEGLIARSPEEHRANGLTVLTQTTATAIDPAAQTVLTKSGTGVEQVLPYDDLVIATGAQPVWPDFPGGNDPRIQPVHVIDDGMQALDTLAHPGVKQAVVVGAGYIGIEMAEACLKRGLSTTVIDIADQPMSTLDADMAELVTAELTGAGVTVLLGQGVTGFTTHADGVVVETTKESLPADIVFVGLGSVPNTKLATDAGLPLGETGAIETDNRQLVLGTTNIWAGGDCVQTYDRIAQTPAYVPLGTHANKHGRVIGLNIAGYKATFPGILGTAVTRFNDLEIARTGLTNKQTEELQLPVRSVTTTSATKSGYMPGASKITVKLVANAETGKLLGGQIIGGPGSGKRIDTLATALAAELSLLDLVNLDLAYAPPISPVWDPVQVTARVMVDQNTQH